MARALALYAVAGFMLATAWLRLEEGDAPAGLVLALVLLAGVPLLARPWWARLAATLVVSVVAVRAAYGLSIADARPRDDERDFFGPLAREFADGALAFFDVGQPFSAPDHPQMHAVVLTAIFAFSLLVALALAARRPLLAAAAVAAGVGWPLTLVPSSSDLTRGALLLGLVLAVLALAGRRPQRTPGHAAGLALLLVLGATAAATSPAVAKSEFVHWKTWDPYNVPVAPVAVDYVWDGDYAGIEFPEEATTVLTVVGPQRPHYWRATTLDSFADDRWFESLDATRVETGPVELLRNDPLLPTRGRDPQNWVRAEVTVEALRDPHLVGPSTPVAWDTAGLGPVQYGAGGVAWREEDVERGTTYAVRSFAPRPTPEQLGRARLRPHLARTSVSRYLELEPGVPVPPWGDPEREERIAGLRELNLVDVERYGPLFERARQIVGRPATPYAAVVALEVWFRSEGGFDYVEQPPAPPAGVPPLVDFVERARAGYCQHYAGAMTLMLRYLGIPARVAVGFTSGAYDADERRWTVTDHNAHAWVEVWFEHWGWVPFDPTPTRGQLAGTYTSASTQFDARAADRQIREGLGGGDSGAGLNLGGSLAEQRLGDLDGNPFRGLGGFASGPAPSAPTAEERGASLLRLLALVLAALAGLIVVAKLVRRLVRRTARDPRRRAAALRREVVEYLVDQGVKVSSSATLEELGRTLQRELGVDAHEFVRSAGAARFSAPDRVEAALQRARSDLRVVRKRMRMRVGVGSRLRGAISLRSLGV